MTGQKNKEMNKLMVHQLLCEKDQHKRGSDQIYTMITDKAAQEYNSQIADSKRNEKHVSVHF